jgi:hypothetical protein
MEARGTKAIRGCQDFEEIGAKKESEVATPM